MIFTRKQTAKMSTSDLHTRVMQKVRMMENPVQIHTYDIAQQFAMSIVHVGWHRMSDGRQLPMYTALNDQKTISSNSRVGIAGAIYDLFLQLEIKEDPVNKQLLLDIYESSQTEEDEE
jgi:hypothetical protein